MTEYFFIVGAQRCATTYLYTLLDEHPDIEMARPMRPEPKFFLDDALYANGISFYRKTYFKQHPPAAFRGEKGTSYIESETAARRIAADFPSARIIFMLRNPVHRAVSNYWFSVANGFEHLDMTEAFTNKKGRIRNYDTTRVSASPYAYLQRGRYADYIAMYLRHFPLRRIKVLITEKFVGSPAAYADLLSFIGAESAFKPSGIDTVINAGSAPESRETDIPPELKAYMKSYFRESNQWLADKLNLDIDIWQSR